MIDLEARQQYRKVIENFRACLISSDEFEEQGWEVQEVTKDPCIKAICDRLWATYTEGIESLTGKNALNADKKALYARCIFFLGSNIEYEWPDDKGVFTRTDSGPIIRILTLGLSAIADKAGDARQRAFEQECCNYGDFNFWPFRTREEFEGEIARQKSVTESNNIDSANDS